MLNCIIVLANEMNKEGKLNDDSISRLRLGCEIYFRNESSYLITPGWNYRNDTDLCLGDVMKEHAIHLGVPDEKIISEINSRDTVGDAFFSKINHVNRMNWKSILVITSDWHVFRAKKIFEFIYGKKIQINYVESKDFYNPKRIEHERKSLKAFEKTFKGVKKGNDIEIFKILKEKHPLYNGNIKPPIK